MKRTVLIVSSLLLLACLTNAQVGTSIMLQRRDAARRDSIRTKDYAEPSDEWDSIFESGGFVFYYNTQKMETPFYGGIQAWVMRRLGNPYDPMLDKLAENYRSYFYSVTLQQFNCKTEQFRTINFVDYDRSGKVIRSRDCPDCEWHIVVPDTIGEGLFDFMCHDETGR